MISDKFLDALEPETASHIKIMQADQWMTPDELGKAQLQYVDVIVDDTPLSATLDSGANSVIINSKYVSEEKRIHSQIVLTSCFGEKRKANVSEFTISLKGGEEKKILVAVCEIEAAILLPSKVFEFLKSESEEAGSRNASCKPVCLQNETGGEDDVELTGGVVNSGNITDGSNLFLLKVSETFEEFLYDVSHISNSGIRDKVQRLIENYIPNKTETTALKMKTILSDEKPIAQRSRRLSLPEKREVEKQIHEWLEQGIIRELFRFFIFGCDVDEASRKYISFVKETGQYEFLKVPFELSISSNYFQRYINYVFRELLRDGTLIIYLDDIIIPATDEKEAYQKLARVLETASRYGIELNRKKCQFLQGKINFLEHVIQNGIIQPSAEKTVSVCNFPEPKNGKDVQSFLGLTGYFRKYIPSYAMIARPLSDLLRGTNPFEFGHAQKIAFQNLKNALSSEPVTDFDYEVVHRPAKQMQHVDALSRHPVMLVTSDELTYKIANAQESDEYIRTIKKLLQEGKTSEFIVSNKILYKISEDQELLVVPEMMQVDVIKKAHSFGHFFGHLRSW
ncbi:retrovirus-related Pol polyprotein from transposon 17.6 [Trichonephila clavipes]|nr:retrovirus-related Pol polyprotein from transposon 17.6 [Trichonephila clavipes]